MKYRGQVRNGVVVLQDGSGLREGALVEVRPIAGSDAEEAPVGSPRAILRHAGIWAGCADEVDRLIAEIHQMKQDELAEKGGDEERAL